MKKLILIPVIILFIGIVGAKCHLKVYDNNDVIIFEDYFGYATYNPKHNMIITSYYVEPQDTIYKDTTIYSIPLLTLSNDSLVFLSGQRELISMINRLSCLNDAEVYWIKYSDSDSSQQTINIAGQPMTVIRKYNEIIGGFFIRTKLFIIMKGSPNYPNIFFDMFKETGEDLFIKFVNVPVEGYTPLFFETFQSVVGVLDSTNFSIHKMKIEPSRQI